jgi:hypothetical protein
LAQPVSREATPHGSKKTFLGMSPMSPMSPASAGTTCGTSQVGSLFSALLAFLRL